MQKYGVENLNDHFMAFNTICDATQVSLPFPTHVSLHNPKSSQSDCLESHPFRYYVTHFKTYGFLMI
jgi:hypothetical protein